MKCLRTLQYLDKPIAYRDDLISFNNPSEILLLNIIFVYVIKIFLGKKCPHIYYNYVARHISVYITVIIFFFYRFLQIKIQKRIQLR